MLAEEVIKSGIPVAAAVIAAIIAGAIAVSGWFVNKSMDRKNEIFKKRLEERLKRRMMMFESFIEAVLPFSNPVDGKPSEEIGKLHELLTKSRTLIQLYGESKEIELFELFIDSVNNRDYDKLGENLRNLLVFFRQNMRRDLGYTSL